MSIFRQKGRQNNAKVFLNDFGDTNNTYFITIGNSVTSGTQFLAPTQDTVEADQNTWDNMFFATQLYREDLSLMIPQYTWIANTRYEAFNKSKNQYDLKEKFYAYNETNKRVYLCMDSPSNVNVLSTDPPTGNSLQLETTADGYTWKFLYELREEELEKFNYPGYIPINEIGTDLFTDSRVLQQNVESSSIQGAIEGITITNQGNAYTDAFNVTFSYSVGVTKRPNTGTNIILEMSAEQATLYADLNKTLNFYNDNYVINFENGYTGVIEKSYLMSNGKFVLELCEDLICTSGSTEPPISEKFRILPRIKIVGNGEGACAIAILGLDKRLNNIYVLNGGQNYTYANAYFYVQNGSVLRPIIALNGLAADITQLLGAKHVMISKKIKPTTALSQTNPELYEKPENIGINYIGAQYNGVIRNDTFYTQIAVLKSPSSESQFGLLQTAGQTTTEIREMTIEAVNPRVNITIGNNITPYTNSNSFFEVGDIIVRGPDTAQEQFRAEIEFIISTAVSTTLQCKLINGAFETFSGYRIKNLKSELQTDGTEASDDEFFVFADTESNSSNAIFAVYQNIFEADNFTFDDALFGSESLKSTEILKPNPGNSYVNPLYPNRVKVKVINTPLDFIISRYEDGVYVPGETMTGLIKNPDGTTTPSTSGTLAAISLPVDVNQNIFSCSYILECEIIRDGIDTPFALVNQDLVSLETNVFIRQGLTGAIGKIIRTALPTNINSNKIYLYVNNYNKEFEVNSDFIYKINDLYDPQIFTSMKIKVVDIKRTPDLIKYSGDLLYISDVGPIKRTLSNTEQIKLLVEF